MGIEERKAHARALAAALTLLGTTIGVDVQRAFAEDGTNTQLKQTEIGSIPSIQHKDGISSIQHKEFDGLPSVQDKIPVFGSVQQKADYYATQQKKHNELPAVQHKLNELPAVQHKLNELPAVQHKLSELPESVQYKLATPGELKSAQGKIEVGANAFQQKVTPPATESSATKEIQGAVNELNTVQQKFKK